MRTARRLLAGGAAPRPTRVLAAVLLVTCFLAAAAPRILEVFQTRTLRQTLAATPSVDRSISVTSGWVTTGQRPGRQLPAGRQADGHHSGAAQRDPAAAIYSRPARPWTGVATANLTVLNPAATARPGVKDPQLELVYRSPTRGHLRLTAEPCRTFLRRNGARTAGPRP